MKYKLSKIKIKKNQITSNNEARTTPKISKRKTKKSGDTIVKKEKEWKNQTKNKQD